MISDSYISFPEENLAGDSVCDSSKPFDSFNNCPCHDLGDVENLAMNDRLTQKGVFDMALGQNLVAL